MGHLMNALLRSEFRVPRTLSEQRFSVIFRFRPTFHLGLKKDIRK
jgi:hypothetical protein